MIVNMETLEKAIILTYVRLTQGHHYIYLYHFKFRKNYSTKEGHGVHTGQTKGQFGQIPFLSSQTAALWIIGFQAVL